jgi:FAD/FMN-containing dehydrogenase
LKGRTVALAGWGRYPVADCRLVAPGDAEEVVRVIAESDSSAIARGNGRSYGDSSLAPDCTLATARLDRMLAFDDATGAFTCESGTLLSDIVDTFVPRGWFVPVTPGTKYVSVGGMIASDVHGKNHHVAGSFCDHVSSIDIALADGGVVHCSRTENADLFAATCGGMGLTGIILRATVRLIRVATARVEQTIIRAPDLDAAMESFDRYQHSTYSVAWLDCLAAGPALGRCLLTVGEHAAADRLDEAGRASPYTRAIRPRRRLPLDFPAFVLNSHSIKLFNSLYYRLNKPGTTLVDLDAFFYPLDAIDGWNRMYGRRGFVQYQCVLPLGSSRAALRELLTHVSDAHTGSFLAVLKRLGAQSLGHLSFPMEGYTLALDFPVKDETFRLLDRLDVVVAHHGGRLYLTKDARAGAQMFAAGYPRLGSFREVRRRYGVSHRFQSLQSRRLAL